jgi:predicted transcriptional regulator
MNNLINSEVKEIYKEDKKLFEIQKRFFRVIISYTNEQFVCQKVWKRYIDLNNIEFFLKYI